MAINDPWAEFNPQGVAPSMGGLEAVPLPTKPPAPRDPSQVRLDDLRAREIEKRLAKPDAPKGGTDDTKLQQKRASLQSLEQQINRVDELYRGGLRDEAFGILSSLGEFLPTETNRQFDTAAAGLAEQGLSAFRVPGVGSQSDTELRQFVKANRPEASDYDATIEEKLRQLRTRVDATRAEMGLPPAQWLQPDEGGEAAPVPEGGEDVAVPPVPLQPSAGKTRSVVSPEAQKVASRIGSLIAKGAGFNQIMGAAVAMDPSLRNDPRFRKSVEDAIGQMKRPEVGNYVKKTGTYPFDPSFYTREEPLSAVESGLTQAASSAPGAYLARAGDAITAGNLDRLAGLTGADQEGAQMALGFAGRDNPTASLLGDITGGTLAALTGEAGLARLGMAPGLLRGAVADAGYGGATNASNATDGNVLGNLAKGALIGGGASVGGQGLLRGTGAVARGVTAPSVRSMADLDVPMTVGQTFSQSGRLGSVVKGLEDRIAGLPVVGEAVNARRLEGLAKMNSKAFDRALEPIGETVAGQYAEDAVALAQDKVGQAFQRALGGKVAGLDRRFIVEAEKAKMAVEKLPGRVAEEVNSSIDEVVSTYFDDAGNITGENMQALLRELDGIKRGYRQDPLGHRIGKAVDQVTDSIENLFRRQAPDVMPQYDAAKQAFKRLSTLEDAVLRAKDTGGIFTPSQLGRADKASTVKFGGKHKAARGGGEFHDMQRAAQEVLPSKVPDSGTAGRMTIPLLAMGAGAGAGAETLGGLEGGTGAGLGLAALLSLAYSRMGQRALAGGAARRGPAAQKIGRRISDSARLGGAAGSAALVGPRD